MVIAVDGSDIINVIVVDGSDIINGYCCRWF